MRKCQKEKLYLKFWMKEESDLIQFTAKAYGERVVLEQCLNTLSKCDKNLKNILEKIFFLYALHSLQSDIGYFLTKRILIPENSKKLDEKIKFLIKELAPQSIFLVQAFGIPDYGLNAPIAADWIGYNQIDNRGELLHARL
eukprot:TRINITY_DN12585_c0_g1_i1.p1 TRINITY_DN12585_c0_g1~~TRINITY_DN12585_c0_g1_i1.p1  ORF type:complete len:141 (+),score=38.51 TRINITY_DN12585_c0_g1_i1:104-526(+)